MTSRASAGTALALLLLLPLAAAAEVSFVPGNADGAPTMVYLEADPDAPINELRLHVKVEGAEDLYGVSFTLRYPDRILRFEEDQTVEGDLLALGPPPPPPDPDAPADDGMTDDEMTDDEPPVEADTVLLVRRRAPKRVILGVTRKGDVGGISGSGTLATLVFRARADIRGRGKFRWEENDLVASNGWAIAEVEWVKGTAMVDTVQPPAP